MLIHRVIPATRRTPHHLSNISSRPVTMDQAQSSTGSSMNLVIHHATQLCRLRKYAAKHLKGRRHHLQRIKLSMDPTQHLLTVPKSSRHPLSSKTKHSKCSSTSPICPEMIARLHFRIVQ